jgi:hypothetical protein
VNAVLIEVNVAGVDRDQGLEGLRSGLVPAISAMPGFVSGTWLTGNADHRGLSLTVGDTEDQAQAFAERFGIGASPQAGAAVERCEVREVAATA